MSGSSIWPIDRTLSDATTPGHGNEGILCIAKSSRNRTLPSDCLVSGYWVLPFCRGTVSVFYSPSQLGHKYTLRRFLLNKILLLSLYKVGFRLLVYIFFLFYSLYISLSSPIRPFEASSATFISQSFNLTTLPFNFITTLHPLSYKQLPL